MKKVLFVIRHCVSFKSKLHQVLNDFVLFSYCPHPDQMQRFLSLYNHVCSCVNFKEKCYKQ